MRDGGRAFHRRKLLETGADATVEENAAVEKINDSYVSRVLSLNLLAPDIIEAILDGRQQANLQLEDLLSWHSPGEQPQRNPSRPEIGRAALTAMAPGALAIVQLVRHKPASPAMRGKSR